ncbi:DUF927 domain-containing protein [Acidithiobacillus acidisediminis]|uniref:DUF927 domain-containing protein n=1 Tax=Acidithiobacillus acidisediminis TaxID=2937799 RepID=UPI00200DA16F
MEYVVSMLPPEFQQVSYVYMFSNSAGIMNPGGSYLKPGIRVHLFFWLTRPVRGAMLAAHLEQFCFQTGFYSVDLNKGGIPMVVLGIDMAPIKSSNQLHYTAEPMIDSGINCDITHQERLGFVAKPADSVNLPDIASDLPGAVNRQRREIRETWAVEHGHQLQSRVAEVDGQRRRYTCLVPTDPNAVRTGRTLQDTRLRGNGAILVLYFTDENTPGSWFVTKGKPWLARRYGDETEIPLEELCPAAVDKVRELGWIEEIRDARDDEVEFPSLRFGPFQVDEKAVTHHSVGKKDIPVVTWLATPIIVDALVRDLSSGQWSYLLKVWDPDGSCHNIRLLATDLTSENFRRALMDHGVRCNTTTKGRELLAYFIQDFPVNRRLTLVESSGWLDEECAVFALPDAVFGIAGDQGTDGYHMAERLMEFMQAYGQAGTLDEWQTHVAALCQGNPLLVLALSAAFLPPLLRLTGMENIGVHFRGPSSSGKTRLLKVASSVWGDPQQYINSWRTTDNALETLAAARNDALLTLDELGSLSAASAGDATYLLGNGQGKGRMRADASARPVTKFRLVFLSSGEISLNQLLHQTNQRSMAGHEVRLLDVKADAGAGMGIIQSLNGFQSARELVDHLDEASRRFYGTPIRAFLTRLLATTEDKDWTVARFDAQIHRLQADWHVRGGDNQVHRVAQRFAAVAAAGELAILWHILPFQEGEAIAAAQWCFQAWLNERGGSESTDIIRAYEALVQKLHLYGSARFEWINRSGQIGLGEGTRVPNPCWGYGKWIDSSEANPQFEFWIPVPTFEAEFCQGVTKQQLAEHLVAKGFMDLPKADTRRVPDMRPMRVYAVKGAILSGELPEEQLDTAVFEVTGGGSG